MLLTRSPLINGASTASSFDLHVLSTPPAFVLSQDQTLRTKTKRQSPEKPTTPQQHSRQSQPKTTQKQKTGIKNKHTIEFTNNTPHPTTTPQNRAPQPGKATTTTPQPGAAATKHKPTHPHPPTANPHNVTPTTPTSSYEETGRTLLKGVRPVSTIEMRPLKRNIHTDSGDQLMPQSAQERYPPAMDNHPCASLPL